MTQRWSGLRQEDGLWSRMLLSAMCLWAIGEFLPYLVGFSQKLAIVFDGEFSFLFRERLCFLYFLFRYSTSLALTFLFTALTTLCIFLWFIIFTFIVLKIP